MAPAHKQARRTTRHDRAQAVPRGPWHASRVNSTPVQLLLDSPSLIYRAFFALPRSIRDPSGQSVNAAHGYLDMVSRLLVDQRPSAVTHVFDADWRPRWRVDAYPGYKAKRAEDPPELPGQFPILRSVLDAAGLPVAEAAVRAKCGVPPSRYVDFAVLRGDPSDGLPGVAGVGEKTAARLVDEYPSLDALVAARDRLPPRVAAALADAGDYLDAMRVVVPVATKLDVELTAPPSPTPSACRNWPSATASAVPSVACCRPCATPASPPSTPQPPSRPPRRRARVPLRPSDAHWSRRSGVLISTHGAGGPSHAGRRHGHLRWWCSAARWRLR